MATPATFNNVLLMVNGSTEQVPINGYLTGVTWTSGEQSGHVVTLTPDGNPIDTNLICSSPRGTISFAPMMIESFYGCDLHGQTWKRLDRLCLLKVCTQLVMLPVRCLNGAVRYLANWGIYRSEVNA